eukprot:TRINITY_DN7552_c0_g1_i1.p1 TRINITY_DN7552_c0_g1~~TRINITY_DN7552_c0_g1_i1.p1  ORF type:complete len:123 (-),score=5.78 TRINITY_DN7552_c0_g1_i1:263-604(-)
MPPTTTTTTTLITLTLLLTFFTFTVTPSPTPLISCNNNGCCAIKNPKASSHSADAGLRCWGSFTKLNPIGQWVPPIFSGPWEDEIIALTDRTFSLHKSGDVVSSYSGTKTRKL